jgi:hypothetical protein
MVLLHTKKQFDTPKSSLAHQTADSFPVLVCYPAFQLFATTFTHQKAVRHTKPEICSKKFLV